jgi:hypothetical protein
MTHAILLAVMCYHLPESSDLTTTGDEARRHYRVGQILVIGNHDTPTG